MRADKFKPIAARFLHVLEEGAQRINADFDSVTCRAYANYPTNEDTRYGGFTIFIDCGFPYAPYENSDNVALRIPVYDHEDNFSICADICWGHPSGKVEAEIFPTPVPVNDENLTILESELPALIETLRETVRTHPEGLKVEPERLNEN